MRVLSCNSPYGQGGIGQHFAQLVEESRDANVLHRYFCKEIRSGDEKYGRTIRPPWWEQVLLQYTPLRWSPSWTSYVMNEFFDHRVAGALEGPLTRFLGFSGKSLRSFSRARALGARQLELAVPNSHVENVYRLHQRAAAETGIDDTWLNRAQVRKTLREYETADTIYVHSEYTRTSFLEYGVPEEKLERTILHVDPRFQPPTERPDDDAFRIVYVGRLSAMKGTPLLLKAFQALDISEKMLTLVGSWGTRRMRKFMQPWLEKDSIHLAPGDPLPALHDADVFVHPTYQDGLGYAPMEALACGTPVIVTEDTGMKEYVREGTSGFVVPTGSIEALIERLRYVADHPMSAPSSFLTETSAARDADPRTTSLDREH